MNELEIMGMSPKEMNEKLGYEKFLMVSPFFIENENDPFTAVAVLKINNKTVIIDESGTVIREE